MTTASGTVGTRLIGSESYSAGFLDGYADRFDRGTNRIRLGGVENKIEFNGSVINVQNRQDAIKVTSIEGLSDADIRDARENNPGFEGETAFKSYYGGRTIVLSGKIRAGTLNKLRDLQDGLKSIFSPLEEAPLVFKGATPDKDLQIMCRKSQPITISETQNNFLFERDFQITLRASDFRFIGTNVNAVEWERTYSEAVLADEPVLYWKLNEQTGSEAQDSSVFSRTGTYSASGVSYSSDFAIDEPEAASHSFDGTNGYVNSDFNPFVSGAVQSYEAWIKRNSTSGADTIFGSTGTNGTNFSVQFGASNNDLYVYIDTSTSAEVFTSTGITTGNWHHIVLQFNDTSNNLALFVDGVSKGSKTVASGFTYDASPGNFKVGAVGATNEDAFDGKIANVAVYQKALAASGAKSHFRAASKEFQDQIYATEVNNAGNYFADAIIKIEGPVHVAASGATGFTISSNPSTFAGSATAINQASEDYKNTPDYEIYGGYGPQTLSDEGNNELKIAAPSGSLTVVDAGETIIVNTAKKTIKKYTSSGVSVIYDQLDNDSEWIKFKPGKNLIFVDSTGVSQPKITFFYRHTFI